MCIIVYRKAGQKPLDKKIWQECWKIHPDGAGFAYFAEDGNLTIDKGFMNFDALYKELEKLQHLEIMVHFRTASPGMAVDPQNTHPFVFSDDVFKTKDGKNRFHWAFTHNGKLPWRNTLTKSDTWLFTQELLGPHLGRDPWFLDNDSGIFFMSRVLETATCWNKMVIMRHDAETGENTSYILNEKKGDNAHGCWFSNQTWIPSARYGGNDFFEEAAPAAKTLSRNSSGGFEFMKVDEFGWGWSFKYDCWLNFDKKTWTDWLPHRNEPYNSKLLDKKPVEPPTGWKKVFVTSADVHKPYVVPIIPMSANPPLSPGDKAELDKDKEIENGIPPIDHLQMNDIALLCKEAVKYLRDCQISKQKIRKMGTPEKIDWIRDAMRSISDEAAHMNYIDLDMWMLALIKDGKFTIEWEDDKDEKNKKKVDEMTVVDEGFPGM